MPWIGGEVNEMEDRLGHLDAPREALGLRQDSRKAA
jgi:hypothetical protein